MRTFPLIEKSPNGIDTVSAQELHQFLESYLDKPECEEPGVDFTMWFTHFAEVYGYDFTPSLTSSVATPSVEDFQIDLNVARHLSGK
jgi:phage anti-repressor protein